MADQTTQQADTAEFAATLLDLDKGRVNDDGADRLREVVAAVSKWGGKGKVTVIIEVTQMDPETFADTGVLLLDARVEAVVPRAKRAPTVFFAEDTNGKITRQDPHRDDPFGDRD